MVTGYKTARTRSNLSAPMQAIKHLLKGKVLDYGAGKGSDANILGVDKYDPYYFPTEPTEKYDTITCHYVLNVLPRKQQFFVIWKVYMLLQKGGTAYFSVRRDLPKEGLQGRGTWQSWVNLNMESIKKTSNYEIYKLVK